MPSAVPAGGAGPGRTGGIAGFVVRRVLLGVLVVLLVSVVVFGATQALPGDPALAILGRSATPESLAALRAQLDLDQPVLTQYVNFLGGLLRGDLGISLAAQQPVSQVLGERLGNSAFLVLVAALVSIPLSLALGVVGALRRDRPFDVGSGLVLLALASLPEFVVAVFLIILFATTVSTVLPAISTLVPGGNPWDDPLGLVLPVATLTVVVTPYVARVMRASMIEVLESDYVEMARLKGLPERVVLLRHALPNALGPTLQVIAISLAYLAGGIVVVEYVFNFPGVGSALQSAVVSQDLPVVQALAMLIASVYVVLNLLADVATILATPRLRTRL